MRAIATLHDAHHAAKQSVAEAAQSACLLLDAALARLYVDLVFHSLSEAARRALQDMNPAQYECQSDFARHYAAVGREEGGVHGRAMLVTRQLSVRFGSVPQDVKDKLFAASSDDLEAIGERLLTAPTLSDALGDLR